jgi:hypothetical protein
MVTVIYPEDQKMVETFRGLLELDKRPVSEKLLIELHEFVDVPAGGMADFVDRCSRKGLYSVFLNRPDRAPAEVCWALRYMDEWFVAYYPALNYYLSGEQQNLQEMREYCHSHGIHILVVDGAGKWLKLHGFDDPLDRDLIASIRTSEYGKAIDSLSNVPSQTIGTAVYCGGIIIDRILRDIARASDAGLDPRRRSPMDIAKALMAEDLISRRYMKDVQWAVDSSCRAISGTPDDFDDVFYFRLIDDLRSLLREVE